MGLRLPRRLLLFRQEERYAGGHKAFGPDCFPLVLPEGVTDGSRLLPGSENQDHGFFRQGSLFPLQVFIREQLRSGIQEGQTGFRIRLRVVPAVLRFRSFRRLPGNLPAV